MRRTPRQPDGAVRRRDDAGQFTAHAHLDAAALRARLGIAAGRPVPESAVREAGRSAGRRRDGHDPRGGQ